VQLKLVEIKIIEVKENKILHRKEVHFEIDHLGSGSPNRIEVKEKLAAMQTAKAELTFIKKMKVVFGLPKLKGYATVYDDETLAQNLEPTFIHIRNMPKEKRAEARKASKSKKGAAPEAAKA
jgi:small subunit ribosomal protein S24e